MAALRLASTPSAANPVRVGSLGADADGVAALPDGAPLYLPGTLPGELVIPGPLVRRGQGWTAAGRVTEASPDRVVPPCPHFGSCGGCSLQHWDDAAYAAWKAGLVASAVARLGFEGELAPIARTAPRERRRIDLAIRRGPGGVIIGLHQPRSGAIVDMRACPVLHPDLLAVVEALRPVLRSLSGLRRDGSAVLNLLDTGPDLLLRTDGALGAQDRIRLTALATAFGLARISAATGPRGEPETACLLRPATVAFAGHVTPIPPGAFLQASAPGEAAIREAVLAALPRMAAKGRIIELFAGCGALTHKLAERARVTAYEGDAEAVRSLRGAGNPRVTPERRDLARQPLQPSELKGADCIVLDPPWAGAAHQMAALAASRLPIIYVSCNPAALFRDGRVLTEAGYAVASAAPIDQFLWSARVESVVAFKPGR